MTSRRTPLAELVSHELHEGGEPRLAAHIDKMGKQRHQQARIGGAEVDECVMALGPIEC
jgi:hypothetical protein